MNNLYVGTAARKTRQMQGCQLSFFRVFGGYVFLYKQFYFYNQKIKTLEDDIWQLPNIDYDFEDTTICVGMSMKHSLKCYHIQLGHVQLEKLSEIERTNFIFGIKPRSIFKTCNQIFPS